MTLTEVLTEVLRWTGVGVALAGSIFAVPEVVLRLAAAFSTRTRQFAAWVRARWRGLRSWLRRLIGRPDKSGEMTSAVALGSAAMGSSGTLSAAVAMRSTSTLGDRVNLLEAQVSRVRTDLDALTQAVSAEAAERHTLERRLSGAVAEVRETLTAMERDAAEVDLTTLPLVGLGVLVSGVPEYLASALPVAVMFLAGSVVFFLWGLRRFVRHLRRLRGRLARV